MTLAVIGDDLGEVVNFCLGDSREEMGDEPLVEQVDSLLKGRAIVLHGQYAHYADVWLHQGLRPNGAWAERRDLSLLSGNDGLLNVLNVLCDWLGWLAWRVGDGKGYPDDGESGQ
jgi:hypothetical protein